ncbi:MAG: tRNA uridine-5-carboxymethylaminomethyl(34) synthesis GTPase MnmE [Oscillospiraceae bacterium]|nr:tRNA uridine-5-carboxymethylaminomethyl(34) synthesis GTPase MnmE [Candidatus Limimonas coprohippi]MCQ2488371.1 tRNA uridine-5-carboxymethylaminomethyl(34) synthesis GTPase MnmE [Clostridia bacterium]
MSTIAAISTPNAAGGIGIVKISGPDALSVADSVFAAAGSKKLSDLPGYSVRFGRIHDAEDILDQAVAIVYRAPKSYTGEDVVELQCHGGLYLMQQVLRLCLKNGAVTAEPGEFTKRAFLNGKMDLTEAESVMTLISAHGRQAADAAFGVLSGSLSNEINEIKSTFISAAAHMSAWVDYPDDEIPELDFDSLKKEFIEAKEKLLTLIKNFDAGQAIIEGVPTVIVGKPNVGKSTLMNLLLGRERSIVTDVAGTTRDVVEETARIGNVVLRLSDTAGIRESDDVVESIGIEYAKTKLSHSSLVLAVIDGSRELDEEDIAILNACKGKPSICILNKTDLGKVIKEEDVSPFVEKILSISAKEHDSFDVLREALESILGTADFDSSASMLINERQLCCCEKCVACVDEAINAIDLGLTMDAVNVSVDAAIEPLLELTGERVSDAVVSEVFSKFCVGK